MTNKKYHLLRKSSYLIIVIGLSFSMHNPQSAGMLQAKQNTQSTAKASVTIVEPIRIGGGKVISPGRKIQTQRSVRKVPCAVYALPANAKCHEIIYALE
jgi:hypothetical protein